MGVPIVQVDAFTDRPFRGNPAGVCVLAAPAPEVSARRRWSATRPRRVAAWCGYGSTATAYTSAATR